MEKSTKTNASSRRNFLKKAAVATVGFHIVPRFVLGKGFIAPSDKVNIGFIGVGRQGQGLANAFLRDTQVQIVAGCDVWGVKRDRFAEHVSRQYAERRKVQNYNGISSYFNYKELLERSDIDGVVIATPDHWHGIQGVDAMKAGKDVYCEKPLTNTIQEGIDLVKTAREQNAIFQTGSMQRSWLIFRKAKEMVSSGKIGAVEKVIVNVGDPARPYDLPEEKVPADIDWNLWCGPAPLTSYHESIAPSHWDTFPDWRFFDEFGGGILTDWGAHMFDIAQWALDKDHTGPVTYIPPSDKGAKRGMQMIYEDGTIMEHNDFGRGWAVRFIGTKGILDVSRGFIETLPSSILRPDEERTYDFSDRGNHYQDWISSMKTRNKPICDVEIGHRSATIGNIANIAYRLGRKLEWDPVKEEFVNDKEANGMKKRRNREY